MDAILWNLNNKLSKAETDQKRNSNYLWDFQLLTKEHLAMGGWESKPRHQQPPPMQILVYKGHWCKIVFRQLWFGAWRWSELGTIQRRYWHLPLYSDVQGEVLFGQFLVLIWPWLHINSDKHHFLCSHFIGLFLISIFPGCFLWGCPRRSLGTWTSSWRRRGATKHSSKATKPWDPGWRRRWGRPHVPADVKRYSGILVFVLYDASTTGCLWNSQVESCFEWKHVWLYLPSWTFKNMLSFSLCLYL